MTSRLRLGERVAPPRFVAFVLLLIVGLAVAIPPLGWRQGVMAAFDAAALVFLVSLRPLMRTADAASMRKRSEANDANRPLLLAISAATMLAILVAVGAELAEKGAPRASGIALIVATLALVWTFVNTVYALHYAHIYYVQRAGGGDSGGIDFPGKRPPGYWDFVYFSFTLGMTFQTSDVQMTATAVRVVAIFQCLAAFVFNLGVVAFTVNVLGSS